MRRGLLGGTFDPLHTAHLIAGEVAYRQLDLDIVTFVPAGAPWQKSGQGVTHRSHRWEMTSAAVRHVPYFEASDSEINRDGWSYTVDTLATYPDDEIFLILGADAAARIRSWKSADQVLDRVSMAIVPRPGTEPAEVEAAVGPTELLDMPLLDISGTEIRARWKAHRPVRFMVPESVYEYAVEHDLYV